MVPIAGYIMYRSLGLKGYQSLRHCIYFTLLCVTSHIITDYITNYGTSIFYPVSAKPYTLGVITVWDFTTVAFFYGMLTLSRHSVFKQRNIMIYGVLIFAVLMIWKRAMLCEAYSQNYHVMEKKKKSARSTKIWLQPNNCMCIWFYNPLFVLTLSFLVYNGKFSVIKYDPKHDRAELERTVEVSSYLSIVHYLNESMFLVYIDVTISHQSQQQQSLDLSNLIREEYKCQKQLVDSKGFVHLENSSLV